MASSSNSGSCHSCHHDHPPKDVCPPLPNPGPTLPGPCTPGGAKIRFVNTTSCSAPIDIYLGGIPIVYGLAYGDLTAYQYTRVLSGTLVGKYAGSGTVYFSVPVEFVAKNRYTIVISGSGECLLKVAAKIGLGVCLNGCGGKGGKSGCKGGCKGGKGSKGGCKGSCGGRGNNDRCPCPPPPVIPGPPDNLLVTTYPDSGLCPVPATSLLRFIHGAATLGNVDLYLGSIRLFSNVAYTETGVPTYTSISTLGQKDLFVKAAGTQEIIAGPIQNNFISGGVYTATLSGLLANEVYPVTLFISHDNPNQCEYLQPDLKPCLLSGQWWRIAHIPRPGEQKCCYRVSVTYTILDTDIRIRNTCLNTCGDTTAIAVGTATIPDPSQPAQISTSFPNAPNPDGLVNTLIHKTDYTSYLLIGSPDRSSLVILSRNRTMDRCTYKKLVALAAELGYNTSLLVVDGVGSAVC